MGDPVPFLFCKLDTCRLVLCPSACTVVVVRHVLYASDHSMAVTPYRPGSQRLLHLGMFWAFPFCLLQQNGGLHHAGLPRGGGTKLLLQHHPAVPSLDQGSKLLLQHHPSIHLWQPSSTDCRCPPPSSCTFPVATLVPTPTSSCLFKCQPFHHARRGCT